MSIVGMELKSYRVEIAKLKSEKEELSLKVGQVKIVLDSMQSIVVDAEKKLQEMLVAREKVDVNECST
jgi:hypothetical protein